MYSCTGVKTQRYVLEVQNDTTGTSSVKPYCSTQLDSCTSYEERIVFCFEPRAFLFALEADKHFFDEYVYLLDHGDFLRIFIARYDTPNTFSWH